MLQIWFLKPHLAAGALPRTPLAELTVLPRPLAGGKRMAAPPQERHPAVLYSELWLCISKLLDVIMVG